MANAETMAVEPFGRKPRPLFAPSRVIIYACPGRYIALLSDSALCHDHHIAQGSGCDPLRQYFHSNFKSHLCALGESLVGSLHRAQVQRSCSRFLEFGSNHGSERDRVDRRGLGLRLFTGELALQICRILFHRAAGGFLHSIPGDALSPCDHYQGDGDLLHALGRDFCPYGFWPAHSHASLPELFCVAAAGTVQGRTCRWGGLLAHFLSR